MSSFRIYVAHPWLWLLLIPVVLLSLWPVLRLPKVRRFTLNRTISLVLHLIVGTILVALLAGTSVYLENNHTNTIILADVSHSTSDSRMVLEAYVQELMQGTESEERTEVVYFGAETTNIEEALYEAEKLLSDEENQRIILLSDGFETDGTAAEAAKALAELGVVVDAVALPSNAVGYEVQVNSLLHSEEYKAGETTELSVTVKSTYEGTAQLKLSDNGKLLSTRTVSFVEGYNEYQIAYTPDTFGIHEISVEVVAKGDETTENNVVYSYFDAGTAEQILLIDGTGQESALLAALLAEDYQITVIGPEEAALFAEDLISYKEVILMNVSNEDLPKGFDEKLKTYVEKYGGGVLTTGGANTYAYGAMADSAFAEFLPLELENAEEPVTALMLVVDSSSSMSGLNHQMAIEGTIICIEALSEIDYVGVLSFDSTVHVIYDLTSMKQKDKIIKAVQGLELGRGTYMAAATLEAYEQLKDFDADNKHVIILSDGNPRDSGYFNTINKMVANGITVSAIAVGQEANATIMRRVAENGNGNFYMVESVEDLPEIMLAETEQAIDDYKNTGSFSINIASYSTLLNEVDTKNLPGLTGYMTTFPKAEATQFLTVSTGEPLYAQWEYGAGKVASFTSDLSGVWSEELFASAEGCRLVKNMVTAVMRDSVTAISMEISQGNTTAELEIEAELSEKDVMKVTVLQPDGTEQTVDMALSVREIYQGTIDISEPGVYTVTAMQYDKNGIMLDYSVKHLAVSYSAEYDRFRQENGEELLAQICRETGGNFAYTASGVSEYRGSNMEQETDVTVPLLITALVLFLCDIAVRKFKIRRRA